MGDWVDFLNNQAQSLIVSRVNTINNPPASTAPSGVRYVDGQPANTTAAGVSPKLFGLPAMAVYAGGAAFLLLGGYLLMRKK